MTLELHDWFRDLELANTPMYYLKVFQKFLINSCSVPGVQKDVKQVL